MPKTTTTQRTEPNPMTTEMTLSTLQRPHDSNIAMDDHELDNKDGQARAEDSDVQADATHETHTGTPPDSNHATYMPGTELPRASAAGPSLSSPGKSPLTIGTVEPMQHDYSPDFDGGLQPPPGSPPDTPWGLPDQDMQAILQPLPPGWVHGQGFSKGLHPTTDVFDQDDEVPQQNACDKGDPDGLGSNTGETSPCDNGIGSFPSGYQDNEAPQQSACGNGEPDGPGTRTGKTSPCDNGAGSILPDFQEGTHPASEPMRPDDDSPSSTSGEQAITQEGHEAHEDTSRYNSGPGGIPEPRGEPSKLTSQQRVRLHELLRSGDLEGLDRSASDEDLWRGYRKKKSDYRALRKRKRADGTWRKDDGRGWAPPHPNRQRSPLPRRQATCSARRVTPEKP